MCVRASDVTMNKKLNLTRKQDAPHFTRNNTKITTKDFSLRPIRNTIAHKLVSLDCGCINYEIGPFRLPLSLL